MPQKQITNLLRNWMEQKKTGQVEINFREGQIRNYTVRESFLVEKEKINNANALDSYSRKQ